MSSSNTALKNRNRAKKHRYNADGTPTWSKRTIDGPGVWVTCIKGKERQTVGETYDLFDAIASELWPTDGDASSDEANELSIEDQIAKEIAAMKGPHKVHRFVNCLTNTPCVVFISCKPPIDPVKLVLTHFHRVQQTGISGTRFIQRMVPSSSTAIANLPEISALCRRIVTPFFEAESSLNGGKNSYKVDIRMRNHTTLTRKEIIDEIARCIPEGYTVDLENPDIFILVEIFKSVCGLSVVKDYYRYHKFNVTATAKSQDTVRDLPGSRRLQQQGQDALITMAPSGNLTTIEVVDGHEHSTKRHQKED